MFTKFKVQSNLLKESPKLSINLQRQDKASFNTVVSNHVNSDHVPSFSCLDVLFSRQTTSAVYAITVTTSAYHSRRCGRL
jgi:hypothetical protein